MDHKQFQQIFCDVLPIMYKAAPVISSFIGSPFTTIILGLLATISRCDACDHQKIADKLQDDPDLYTKLEKLESTHAQWLKDFQLT